MTPYSPPISATLDIVGGWRFDVAEVGEDHVALRDARSIGPAEAILIVRVDDRVRRMRVELPEGIEAGRDRQPIRRLDDAPAVGPQPAMQL